MNRCLVDMPLYNKYLVCRFTRLLINFKTLFLCYFVFYLPCLQATRLLLYSLTCQLLKSCSYVTLSFIHPVYRQLAHSSTRLHVNFKTLFLCYFVFYLPCLQATRSLVYLFTRLLAHFFCHFIFLPFNFLFIFALSFEK